MKIKRMIPHGKVDCYRYIAIALLTVLPLVSYSEERLMQPVEDVLLEEIAPVWLDKSPIPPIQKTTQPLFPETKKEPTTVQPQTFAIRDSVQTSTRNNVNANTANNTAQTKNQKNGGNLKKVQATTTTNTNLPLASFSIDSLIKAAQQGNVEAQYQLGMRYQYGDGVDININKANQWLAKAATSGDARSQHALAMFYQQYATNIEGMKKALLWEKKAADRGSADAQYALGVMFKNGRLVRKNEAEARKWLAMAARQGHLSAQLVLQE